MEQHQGGIGSHDKDADRSWEWTDTTPWTYANWARVEHTGDWWLQNCGHMFANDGTTPRGRQFSAAEWHIVMCDLSYNFVCEQPAYTRPRHEVCNTTTTLCLPTTTTTSTTSTTATSTATTTTRDVTYSNPSSDLPVCNFTYNRICALRVDYCAQAKGGGILTYDQQLFTSDDMQNTNLVDGKYIAPESGQYSVNFWTKGFTSGGKVELYHNDKKIEWNEQNIYDQYHADVALTAGDILYIWISDMKHCQWADSAWRLLNSVFCIEPTGGAVSTYSIPSTTATTSDTTTTSSTTSKFTTIPGACIEEGVDFFGGDVGYIGDTETSLQCACSCRNKEECKFFTYNAGSKLCILKATEGTRRSHSK